MEFPHLNDTAYPNLDNVDVYKYENVFDYTRWKPNTKIYLLNVRWNGDYENTVKFENDSKRDEWFDKKAEESGLALTLTTNTLIIDGTVKVPMPYDIASQYNYLVADVPVMTSDDKMLDYETSDGYRRWHFFISDYAYGSPSATTLTLALDYWTQYINSVGISYMFLERGHAPVAETDTNIYLSNPIENCTYLLAPDVNYGDTTVARGGKFVPFGNGEKYVCFCSVCDSPASLGTVRVGESFKWSDATIADGTNVPDATGRWNSKHEVNDYNWGRGRGYGAVNTHVTNHLNSIGRGLNNAVVYAITEAEADAFIKDCEELQPMFLNTVKACFIVAKEMIWDTGNNITIAGHTLKQVWGNKEAAKLADVKLTREMFDIPTPYSHFAKLYTSPYSELEITDNNGKTVTVKVEETGAISAYGFAALSYPFLNIRVFLTGIGGVGSNSYKWVDINGTSSYEMHNSDWYKFCFDSEIPTYELCMDGETSWELGNWNRAYTYNRRTALNSYHDAIELADNERQNAYDSADKNKNNADASADTARTNARNSAATARTNTYNEASNMDTCHSNMRANASQITSNNNAASTANLSASQENTRQQTKVEADRQDYTNQSVNGLTQITAEQENQKTTQIAANTREASLASTAGQTAGAVISGAMSGGLGGLGSALGGIATGIGDMAAANITHTNASATTNCTTAIANATVLHNTSVLNTDIICNAVANNNTFNQQNSVLANNVANATANTNSANTCDQNVTNSTIKTMKTNADNSRDTAYTNADNSRDTAKANATRERDTAKKNANYSCWQKANAAQRGLANAQNSTKAQSADASNYRPVTIGTTANRTAYAPDYYRNRGVQIKVRTQGSDAIAQAASEFARYGYALNQIWHPDDLCPMIYYTYWKARDCWVYDLKGSNDTAQTAIELIFKNGVTVWSNPDEIGKVDPYEN